jgi:hypothetical protein
MDIGEQVVRLVRSIEQENRANGCKEINRGLVEIIRRHLEMAIVVGMESSIEDLIDEINDIIFPGVAP